MSESPKLLDLFCKAGGASRGYQIAGFHVTGVDIEPQPRYPFRFVQAEALAYLTEHGREYDLIHASPPCQAYLKGLPAVNRARHPALPLPNYPDLLAPTRAALIATGKPWVIENIVGAPLHYFVQLCGAMFGLRVYRHRRFETSCLLFQPPHPRHTLPALAQRAPSGKSRKEAYLAGECFASVTGNAGNYAGPGMGINWMIGSELSQAVPPAYTEYLGRQLLTYLGGALLRELERRR